MARALIVFGTRSGHTQKIADLIAEGLRISGVETQVVNVTAVKSEKDLHGFDAYVFGSPTYHGEMLSLFKKFLFLAEKAGLQGKPGGAFGAFGWSGEGVERVYNTMKHALMMDMTPDPLRLKSADLGGGIQAAQGYGQEIAAKIRRA